MHMIEIVKMNVIAYENPLKSSREISFAPGLPSLSRAPESARACAYPEGSQEGTTRAAGNIPRARRGLNSNSNQSVGAVMRETTRYFRVFSP
jgi:hypothetical protein